MAVDRSAVGSEPMLAAVAVLRSDSARVVLVAAPQVSAGADLTLASARASRAD